MTIGPNSLRCTEYFLAVLADADLPGGLKMELFATLNSSICQFAQWEANQGTQGAGEQWQVELITYLGAAVATGDYPHLAAAMASGGSLDLDPDAMFERAIGRVVDLILTPPRSRSSLTRSAARLRPVPSSGPTALDLESTPVPKVADGCDNPSHGSAPGRTTMRYRTLGGTGIEVSAHCLGAMMFGAVGNPDHEDCTRILHTALDHGINFVDTADMYSAGESEEIVGKALEGRRDEVVLATKVHFPMGEGPNRNGNSRRWIVKEVEESLRRLRTDWIDLYQIHRPDPRTDIEETLAALTDLVRAGKIRAFGPRRSCRSRCWRRTTSPTGAWPHRFRTEQPPYSLLTRGIEAAMLPMASRLGMGVLTWSPLASGS